ncbi:MAG: hypothetical protein ACREC5_02030, partial [Thermoplasmata archaeon]
GVFGVPYADSTNATFPYSYPVFGGGPLEDHQLVYDTEVGFEIVNPNPTYATFLVVSEVWTPGTATVIENVTGPNGTTTFEPVQEPARLDPTWSNATVTAAPYSSGEVELPLRTTGTTLDLEVSAGTASWELSYLTPATSSVAGVYTGAGIWAFGALISGITLIAILGGLAAARRLAERIGRSPPVPRWWPVIWVAVPFLWFSLGYVSFNQVLGTASPAILPIPVVIAAFPYLPRLFTRYFDMTEVEGIEPLTLDDAANPKVILPLVRHQGGLKCAPQTWREAFLSHYVGLPEVRGYEVKLLGGTAKVQPRLLPVSNPLTSYYTAEATASCWFDARKGIKRPRHRIEWRREERLPVFGPDGVTQTGGRTKRRFSPHVVAGCLEASFPPKRPIADELAGVRSAEVREHDHEIERIMNADLRGTMDHLAHSYARDEIAAHEEARQRQDRPRTREELARVVERNRKSRGGAADVSPTSQGGSE